MASTGSNALGNFDSKEILNFISATLPNIGSYFKLVLKKEKLSEEAEAFRKKYDTILSSLELGYVPGGRPTSIMGDDDSGYCSSNRIRGDLSESAKQSFPQSHSGYFLWQDEKQRWQRCWGRVEYRSACLYIYEDSNEEVLLKTFSLESTTTKYEDQSLTEANFEKENSFVVSGVNLESSVSSESSLVKSCVDVHFAAYTDSERRKWTEIFQLVSSSARDSGRLSLSTLDNHAWTSSFSAAVDSTSSSSNFSSNRDSMVSNSSSLINRMSARADIGDNIKEVVNSEDKLMSTKQHQPLPCPPEELQGDDSQQGAVPVDKEVTHNDEDSGSVGTIYESIDNLVSQFDVALRQIGENMRAGSPQSLTKKKEQSLLRQHSFLSSRSKSKTKLLTEKKAELEKGERYSGYLWKKTNTGSWKKRWCVLKGCMFCYYKSQNDTSGHEYALPSGRVEEVSEGKKKYTFNLLCKGVPEMQFSLDEEDSYHAWVNKLQAACSSEFEPNADKSVETMKESAQFADSIYSVPRTLAQSTDELYDVPRGSMALSADAAIDAGIYSVPRALLEGHMETESTMVQEESQNLFPESFNLYNFPRGHVSPDDEGIYDDPLDIVDMEIYDYPPDAAELGLETDYNAYRNSSVSATSSELILSDSAPADPPKVEAVPPVPSSSRPRLQTSAEIQNVRASTISHDSIYDHPRPQSESILVDSLSSQEDLLSENSIKLPDLSLEYGQCSLKGFLYKKERFMTWIKLFCVIRNNFLECHKYQTSGNSYTPVLKLFLPRSEVVEGGGDAKRKWAFQIKHPRREGVLTFATDTEEDCHQWMKAFQDGASIQVQPVSTVEEIRITDLDMQKRWTTTTENGEEDDFPRGTNEAPGLAPRSSTFSVGSTSEDYNSDTLKRRKKFHWVKPTFIRRKTEKNISSSQSELSSRLSNVSFDQPENMEGKERDHLRKSVSLELLPSTVEDQEIHEPNLTISKDALQGYLRLQRKGADNTWVRYWCVLESFRLSCYISQRDLTLTLSIDLHGSRISYANGECHRPHSFKIFHPDSGQCLFLAAEDNSDLNKWFSEITKDGREMIPDDSMDSGPFMSVYELPKVSAVRKQSTSSGTPDVAPLAASKQPLYKGVLMKATHTGKWKKRCCQVEDGVLHVSRSFMDKVPIITLPLESCSLELLSVSSNVQYSCQFKLKPSKSDKTHTFATTNESDLYGWIGAIRKASCEQPISLDKRDDGKGNGNSNSTLSKRKSKKLNNAELISHVPASCISSPDCSGYANVQFGTDPWAQYWCVAHNNCLYVYSNKEAAATMKTVVLPGYKVGVRELHSTKYANNLVLKHEGVAPVWLAFADHLILEKWAEIFIHYTRAEQVRKGSTNESENSKGTIPRRKKSKGELYNSKEKLQKSIIHKYEKKIRKTQRVANQTELKLKKQQASLLHFKKELSKHLSKLDELSTTGNERAKKRLKSVHMKIAQIDKIVPYLEKYVAVNRQAEIQTISVLKESCTMELRQHGSSASFDILEHYQSSPSAATGTTPSDQSTPMPSEPLQKEENPYATLSEVRQEADQTVIRSQGNYAELNFPSCDKAATRRPPSVNYVEVQILSTPKIVPQINENDPGNVSKVAERSAESVTISEEEVCTTSIISSDVSTSRISQVAEDNFLGTAKTEEVG